MQPTTRFVFLVCCVVLLFSVTPASVAQGREELIRIPRQGTPAGMLVRVCRPEGRGNGRLVVINHGRPGGKKSFWRSRKRNLKPYDCGRISKPFTSRGFVVVMPLRRGYGDTGGRDREGYGRCDSPDFVSPSYSAADDIYAAIKYFRRTDGMSNHGAIVIGQSAGGMATIAP